MKQKIIIDTDPGVDDGLAIQLAFESPELDVVGLTTVFGNVSVERSTINALRFVEMANKFHVSVAQGASHPLVGEFRGGVPFIHGDDGQGNTWQPESSLVASALSATDYLIQQITRYPKEITLVAIGPLTNLALMLQPNSAIASLVKEVVIMGGNVFCPGNASPVAEANILSDPEAANIVFGAEWDITMVGLDVTHKVFMHKSILEMIASSGKPVSSYIASTHKFYQDFVTRTNKIDGTFVHDASAIAYLLAPQLFTTITHPLYVETSQTPSRGKIRLPLSGSDNEEDVPLSWRGRPNVRICVDVRGGEVVELIMSRLV